MAEKLKIIPLGGLNEIGKNMTAYEYGGEIIVVDCGMAFPGDDMYGIDCVIPDVSYLIKNQTRLRGLFITHGHEDHIGAIPYVLKQVNMPIYCTRFTAGLIKLKLQEHRPAGQPPSSSPWRPGSTVRAGKFQVEFIHVNHSIADSVAFAIHTRMGAVVHTGDFKIDSTPIDGEVIDLARFGALGKEGVLALLADSTNVERPGYTMSERAVGKTFTRQFTGLQEAHHRHHLRQQRPPHPAGHRRRRRLRAEGGRHRPQHGEHHEGLHGAGLHEGAQGHRGGHQPASRTCRPSSRSSSPPAPRARR